MDQTLDVRHSSSSSVDTHQGLSEFCAKHLDLRIDTSNRLSVTERGEVYKAIVLESRVVVAVKVLFASNPRLEAKFRFELDSQKRIPPHENIVGLLNTRIEAVEPLKLVRMYIVTEYCNGGTLDAYLRANPLQDAETIERRAGAYIGQLLRGLAHLHAHQIIHQDLRISNIMVACHESTETLRIMKFWFCAWAAHGSSRQVDQVLSDVFQM